ncbi:V(D)J recombination-activating protein 1-like isoform X2 [Acanthaster planci]|nr:V(D)J recombination-activating protein 1-like isoform X2 [Acanthaster planci]
MEEHISALGMMCRICGQVITSSKNRSSLARYRTELLAVYKLNLDEEQEGIHPSIVCNKCRRQMQRAHSSMQQGKQYQGTLPKKRDFSAHDASCWVCSAHAAYTSHIHPQFGEPSTSGISDQPSTSSQDSALQSSHATAKRSLFGKSVPDPGLASHGKKHIWSVKASLSQVRRDHARRRTKEASEWITDFCEKQKESKTDVLYFLLCENLKECSDSRYREVLASWSKETNDLSAEDCLAMRVTTKTSKSHYEAQYKKFRAKGISILKPPHALNELEKTFMPGNVRFRLEGGTDVIHHTPVKVGKSHAHYGEVSFEPLDLNQEDHPGLETPFPNMKGVAWPYPHALAKTLEELDAEITAGMETAGIDPDDDLCVLTTIKDGADGMGDISITKSVRERLLPDKAFRAAFAVIKCEVVKDGERVTVYEPDAPDSTFITRPLIEAIADENNRASASVLLDGMEQDRVMLQSKEMAVNVGAVWRRHKLKIFNSMIDEKLDRANGGLQGSGSRYICTLCHATTKDSAKTDLGSFCITRSFQETKTTAQYMQVNPDNLSSAELGEIAKGVKSHPILQSEPQQKLLDATHADINMGNFFKKLIICEIARVQTWDITKDVKPMFEAAEKLFNDHVTQTIGLVPKLMMPGNFARDVFNSKNTEHFLALIADEGRKRNLAEVLDAFRNLRKIYRAHHPDADDVCTYKEQAVAMGLRLLTDFPYAGWPNYLHKIIEHVQEGLEDPEGPRTIGGISGEGNEAANKLFRELRGHFSRQHDETQSLRDVLWFHWLYTSPKLKRIGHVETRKYQCSQCKELGHNSRSCPN